MARSGKDEDGVLFFDQVTAMKLFSLDDADKVYRVNTKVKIKCKG